MTDDLAKSLKQTTGRRFQPARCSRIAVRTGPQFVFLLIVVVVFVLVRPHGQTPKTFRVWAFADAHVDSDERGGRESLAEALRQSESASGFDWDIALDLGEMSGAQGTPKDSEGEEIVRQFGALKQHRREQVYDLSGNHDRSGLDEPQAWWWRKWLDPTNAHYSGAAHFPIGDDSYPDAGSRLRNE